MVFILFFLVSLTTDEDAVAAAQRCFDGRAVQPIAGFEKLSKNAFDSATQVAHRFSTASNTNAAVNEKVNTAKFEKVTEVEEVAKEQLVEDIYEVMCLQFSLILRSMFVKCFVSAAHLPCPCLRLPF